MTRLTGANRAVRMVGLKLLLLSFSVAVFAAVSPVSDESLAQATWGGMKLLHLILGTMGAGASLFFLPQFTGKALGATVTCGIICATVGTPVLAWIFGEYVSKTAAAQLPGPVENLLAMALGIAGVYIIPGIQRASNSFKTNPFGVLDWLRGRAAPPGASEDRGGQP